MLPYGHRERARCLWKLHDCKLCMSTRVIYLVPWATNDGWEDGPGGVITGETGLAHAGAIVNDQSGCVLVTHLEICLELCWLFFATEAELQGN